MLWSSQQTRIRLHPAFAQLLHLLHWHVAKSCVQVKHQWMLTWLLLAGPEEVLLGPQPWLSLTEGSLFRVGAQGSLILLGKSLLSFEGAMPATTRSQAC